MVTAPKTAAGGLDYLKGLTDKPITEAEAKKIIAEFGTSGFDNGRTNIAANNYGDAVASAITGLSKENAYMFLDGLVSFLDRYDTSTNNTDYILTGNTSDIYSKALFAKDANEVKRILSETTNPYKAPPNTQDVLQKLLDTGKTNTTPLDYEKSLEIINSLGISFGSTADEFASALVGLTRTEAFVFLADTINRLDEADGGNDKNADYKIEFGHIPADEILVRAGLAPDYDGDRLGISLNLISDVFRDPTNPSDKEYRDYLDTKPLPKDGKIYNTLMKHQETFNEVAALNHAYYHYPPQYTQPVPYNVSGNTGIMPPNQNSNDFLNTIIPQITAGIQKQMTGGFTSVHEEGIYAQMLIGYMGEGKYQTGTIPDMTGVPSNPDNPQYNIFTPGSPQYIVYQEILDNSKKQGVNGVQYINLNNPYWGLSQNAVAGTAGTALSEMQAQVNGASAMTRQNSNTLLQQLYGQQPYTVNGSPNQLSPEYNAYISNISNMINNINANVQSSSNSALSAASAMSNGASNFAAINADGTNAMMRMMFG